MPLTGKPSHDIPELMESGRPQKQAVAIALKEERGDAVGDRYEIQPSKNPAGRYIIWDKERREIAETWGDEAGARRALREYNEDARLARTRSGKRGDAGPKTSGEVEKEGAAAAQSGKKISDNPYPGSDKEHHFSWRRGFNAKRGDADDINRQYEEARSNFKMGRISKKVFEEIEAHWKASKRGDASISVAEYRKAQKTYNDPKSTPAQKRAAERIIENYEAGATFAAKDAAPPTADDCMAAMDSLIEEVNKIGKRVSASDALSEGTVYKLRSPEKWAGARVKFLWTVTGPGTGSQNARVEFIDPPHSGIKINVDPKNLG